MQTEPPTQAAKPPRRNRWRMRILLAMNALLAVLFVISRLEPTQVKSLGPTGQYVYDLINPPAVPEISTLGKRLMADVKVLGGQAQVMQRSQRYFGLLGTTEEFFIGFTGTEIDDKALERFVKQYGDHVWGLDLRKHKRYRRRASTLGRAVSNPTAHSWQRRLEAFSQPQ